MNDEALPSYKEMMLQMRLGLNFLNETFGVRPNTAWQIDPFGHNAVTVSVLYKLGYEKFVGNRMSEDFKTIFQRSDGFNFYWQGHQVTRNREDSTLFTHILQKHYGLQIPGVYNEKLFLNNRPENFTDFAFQREVYPAFEGLDHLPYGGEKKPHKP